MAESIPSHWRELCAAAAAEPDSQKFTDLIDRIIKALDESRDGLSSPKRCDETSNP